MGNVLLLLCQATGSPHHPATGQWLKRPSIVDDRFTTIHFNREGLLFRFLFPFG
jgi:hypothetical protein